MGGHWREAIISIGIVIALTNDVHGLVTLCRTTRNLQSSRLRTCIRMAGDSIAPSRVAVISGAADEMTLASGLSSVYGSETAILDMKTLLKGKRGRKTEKSMATTAKQAIDAAHLEGKSWVLTGFPATAAEAEALESAGVSVDRIVVVQSSASEENGREYGKHGEKVVEVPYNSDPASIATSIKEALGVRSIDSPKPKAKKLKPVESKMIDMADTVADGDETVMSKPTKVVKSEPNAKVIRAAKQVVRKLSTQLSEEVANSTSEDATTTSKVEEVNEPVVPWYAAVAKPTGGKKKLSQKKSAVVAAAASATIRDARPSQVVQRLSSAAPEMEIDKRPKNIAMRFGDLVLKPPMSDCLKRAGILEPTPIQAASMVRIASGESVILHAVTGSGKTLAFLLPLLKRVAENPKVPRQIFIASPTRELAVQIAREAVLLQGGNTDSVAVLIEPEAVYQLAQITAPVVVGTSKVLAPLVKKVKPWLRKDVHGNASAIVCDEVDRLVDTLSKYSTAREVQQRERHPRPIMALLEMMKKNNPNLQVIACSATVGRPLRRELSKALEGGNITEEEEQQPFDSKSQQKNELFTSKSPNIEPFTSKDLAVIRDVSTEDAPDLAHNRAVGIPPQIEHLYRPLFKEDYDEKLKALCEVMQTVQAAKPIVFIPPQESVNLAVLRLKANGFTKACALHEAFGFGSNSDGDAESGDGFSHISQALEVHDELTQQYLNTPDPNLNTEEPTHQTSTIPNANPNIPVLVASADSARGLDFRGLDTVFLVGRARSPDEYVHLAGRTGRQGKEGTVVSIVTYKEVKTMMSWCTQLKVDFKEMRPGGQSYQ